MAEASGSQVAKRIEMAANVAIILASAAVIVVFARNFTRTSTDAPPTIATGTKFALKDAHWRSGEKTMVFAISTTCHLCNESAPFYHELVWQCKQQHVRTIAVLPQPTVEAEPYLKDKGIAVGEVRQAILSGLRINGTPTLLLVDGGGIVRSVWIGKLESSGEKEVLAKLSRP
jgi:hypothetical protein